MALHTHVTYSALEWLTAPPYFRISTQTVNKHHTGEERWSSAIWLVIIFLTHYTARGNVLMALVSSAVMLRNERCRKSSASAAALGYMRSFPPLVFSLSLLSHSLSLSFFILFTHDNDLHRLTDPWRYYDDNDDVDGIGDIYTEGKSIVPPNVVCNLNIQHEFYHDATCTE